MVLSQRIGECVDKNSGTFTIDGPMFPPSLVVDSDLVGFILFFFICFCVITVCTKWQGSKGIRQLPINWCTSPMMIHKIIPAVN